MKKKKTKRYAEGGLAGIAENAEALMGDVDNLANTINYGSSTPNMNMGSSSVGFGSITGMKKGGPVKKYKKGGAVASASKRADGCVTKGRTKGRFV